jgi:hypothetical protein
VKNRFQSLPFKRNLQRYIVEEERDRVVETAMLHGGGALHFESS